MPLKDLYGLFPKLKQTQHAITSDSDKNYNCVAWVLGKTKEFWTPFGLIIPASFPPYRWHSDVPQDGSLSSYKVLFQKFGFSMAGDSKPERGYEKIALYEQDDKFTHVAKQVDESKWSSKLGDIEDIEHELKSLEKKGPLAYGRVACFMKRPKSRRR